MGLVVQCPSLNVQPELSYFGSIVPCGIEELDVTSMARELGRQSDITDIQRSLVAALGRHLDLTMRWAGTAEQRALLRSVVAAAGMPG